MVTPRDVCVVKSGSQASRGISRTTNRGASSSTSRGRGRGSRARGRGRSTRAALQPIEEVIIEDEPSQQLEVDLDLDIDGLVDFVDFGGFAFLLFSKFVLQPCSYGLFNS